MNSQRAVGEIPVVSARRYRGTLLVVTHDRYFAAQIGVRRHWHVEAGAVIES